jgi:hypothetical protein
VIEQLDNLEAFHVFVVSQTLFKTKSKESSSLGFQVCTASMNIHDTLFSNVIKPRESLIPLFLSEVFWRHSILHVFHDPQAFQAFARSKSG